MRYAASWGSTRRPRARSLRTRSTPCWGDETWGCPGSGGRWRENKRGSRPLKTEKGSPHALRSPPSTYTSPPRRRRPLRRCLQLDGGLDAHHGRSRHGLDAGEPGCIVFERGHARDPGCDSARHAGWPPGVRQRLHASPSLQPAMSHAPLFELSWRGGASEHRLHRHRRGSEDMPWGSLDLASFGPGAVEEARRVWTNGVFTEYASAAAFSALTAALLECGAPVDLTAVAADIVVDELFHVELSGRLTTELGGAVPLRFDLEKIAPLATPGARALMRASELAVATSCVSETLSVPAMARSRAMATSPLVRAVLDRLVADEGPHARLGFWFLDWAADRLTDAERARLADLAMVTLEVYAPLWREP